MNIYQNTKENYIIGTLGIKHDEVKIIDNKTILLKDNEVVGFNILNANLFNHGIVNPTKENIKKLEIESIKEEKPYFIIGKIIEIKKHPKSEKLNICQVDLGSKIEQIVCGASNVEENIKVIVARENTVMPNGMLIKPSKLLEEKSNGMICSLSELGQEQTKPGIHIVENGEVGSAFFKE